MTEQEQNQTTEGGEQQKPSLRGRILKKALFCLYILILLEIGSRAYWSIKGMDEGTNLPFFPGRGDWDVKFYEEMGRSGVLDADLSPDNGRYDVLFLGGSALDRVHLYLAQKSGYLQESIEDAVDSPVRVFNLAEPAMTTRDSLIKYGLMGDERSFDLVVVYHGVNDARMNCCPPEVFEPDYTHVAFYLQYKRLDSYGPFLNILTLPYTVEYTIIHVMDSKTLDMGIFVPRHRMNEDWVGYGTDIKTEKTFRDNIRGIIDMAGARREPLMLMTFAWHIPDDYSMKKLKAGELDYAESVAPSAVELWGSVESVKKALETHNRVVLELAGDYDLFIDAAKQVSGRGRLFNDVCHLSDEGRKMLVDLMAAKITDSQSE